MKKELQWFDISEHYLSFYKMGLMSDFEYFYRILLVKQDLALNQWGEMGIIYLDFLSGLLRTSVRVSDVAVTGTKSARSFVKWLTKYELTFSFVIDPLEFNEMFAHFKTSSRYYVSSDMTFEKTADGKKVGCTVNFSN